ncbi:hypothetical protein [Lonepinella sp. BR2357]|uniref:hypothetical protein n=1 Tax=Lonepinella sp. BR2357 TaxID=3434549 RepID=UPI003F6DD465
MTIINAINIDMLSAISQKLLQKITELFDDNIELIEIKPNQYHDIYTFQYQAEIAKFKIYYNSNNKISKIIAINSTENTKFIAEKLSLLINQTLVLNDANSIETTQTKIEFNHENEEFLTEFHQLIQEILNNAEMHIQAVQRYEYNLRYTIQKQEEIAVFDIYFNAKHEITNFHKITTKSSSMTFATQVENIIKQGLGNE